MTLEECVQFKNRGKDGKHEPTRTQRIRFNGKDLVVKIGIHPTHEGLQPGQFALPVIPD